jgi:predicted transcriptional regulator of viral defense system
MVVNRKVYSVEKIRELLRDQNGVLLTSDLAKRGISRVYLAILEKNGEIERVSRGVYTATSSIVDEMASFQAKYHRAIFSHESALYLHDLTDRSPLLFSVTVPSGYNATSLKASGAKVFFVKRELFGVGMTTVKSSNGNDVQAYDLERTICDIVRSRNQMDVQFFNEALKRYAGRKDKNLDLLFHYTGQFKMQNIVRHYLEVLL